MSSEKVVDINLYKLLQVDPDASESAIRSAYRKQAKTCHPDKSGDPASVHQFHILTEALNVLTIKDQREEYDELLKKQQEKQKAEQKRKEDLLKQDVKTRRLREQLRKREQEAECESQERYQEDVIQSYRQESRKLLEEEQDKLIEKLSNLCFLKEEEEKPIIKLKWAKDCNQYTEPLLRNIFNKYGEVENIVAKKRSALIEYKHLDSAILAAKAEIGLEESPLVLKALFSDQSLSKSIFVKYACAISWPKDVAAALKETENYVFDRLCS